MALRSSTTHCSAAIVDTLFGGEVVAVDPSEKPAAVRAFDTHAVADDRVDLVMLPIADGVTLARRRG